jgi:hypothetical protein
VRAITSDLAIVTAHLTGIKLVLRAFFDPFVDASAVMRAAYSPAVIALAATERFSHERMVPNMSLRCAKQSKCWGAQEHSGVRKHGAPRT